MIGNISRELDFINNFRTGEMPVQQLVSEDERPEQQCDGPGSGKSKPSAVTARSEEPSQWSPRMKSFHQWGR